MSVAGGTSARVHPPPDASEVLLSAAAGSRTRRGCSTCTKALPRRRPAAFHAPCAVRSNHVPPSIEKKLPTSTAWVRFSLLFGCGSEINFEVNHEGGTSKGRRSSTSAAEAHVVSHDMRVATRRSWTKRSEGGCKDGKKWRRTRGAKVEASVGVRPRLEEGKRVLITGATKGLGAALAKKFVQEGDCVCLCSRNEKQVMQVVQDISNEGGIRNVCGTTCDVSDETSVASLFAFAKEQMGGIDIVINNAGTNAYVYENLVDADVGKVREVVMTNALGTLLCCREALRMFREQPEGGHIFNLEGAGSDGRPTKMFATYGFTKAGMRQLSKTLQVEVNEAGGPRVGIHTISPGMIFTEMIASGRYSFGERGRFFVNLLAEDANVVAESLVKQIRAVIAKPEAKSATQSIQYLKPPDVFKRLVARLVLGINKNRWYPEAEQKELKN